MIGLWSAISLFNKQHRLYAPLVWEPLGTTKTTGGAPVGRECKIRDCAISKLADSGSCNGHLFACSPEKTVCRIVRSDSVDWVLDLIITTRITVLFHFALRYCLQDSIYLIANFTGNRSQWLRLKWLNSSRDICVSHFQNLRSGFSYICSN